MFKRQANCKKTISFGFFAAFLVVFLSANSTNAAFWDWFGAGSDNVAATAANSKTYTLKTNKSGQGTVTSDDGKINCGLDCKEKYNSSSVVTVTLTATPSSGYSFDKWSGGNCKGSGTCTVKMTKSITVTAKFKKEKTQKTFSNSFVSSSSNSDQTSTSTYYDYKWIDNNKLIADNSGRYVGNCFQKREVATYACDAANIGNKLYDGANQGPSYGGVGHAWPIYEGANTPTATEYMYNGCGLKKSVNGTLNEWECKAFAASSSSANNFVDLKVREVKPNKKFGNYETSELTLTTYNSSGSESIDLTWTLNDVTEDGCLFSYTPNAQELEKEPDSQKISDDSGKEIHDSYHNTRDYKTRDENGTATYTLSCVDNNGNSQSDSVKVNY